MGETTGDVAAIDITQLLGYEPINVGRYCRHHIPEAFDCGDNVINELLLGLAKNHEHGDPTVIFDIVDHGGAVMGFISLTDRVFQSPDGSQTRFLFINGIGVDKRDQFGALLRALANKAEEIAEWHRRNLSPPNASLGVLPYSGFLAIRYNDRIGRYLETLEFTPVETGYYWYRNFSA